MRLFDLDPRWLVLRWSAPVSIFRCPVRSQGPLAQLLFAPTPEETIRGADHRRVGRGRDKCLRNEGHGWKTAPEGTQANADGHAFNHAPQSTGASFVFTAGNGHITGGPSLAGFPRRANPLRRSPMKDFSLNSGERQTATQYMSIRADHRFRYEWADAIIPAGGQGLDLFCGVGYGTQRLAHNDRYVIGMDGSAKRSRWPSVLQRPQSRLLVAVEWPFEISAGAGNSSSRRGRSACA